MRNTVHFGDALTVLQRFPAGSAQTCVTSPPYWGLRDYGTRRWFDGDPRCEHDREIERGAHHPGQVEQTKWSTGEGAGVGQNATTYSCSRCGAWWGQLGLEPTPELYVEHLVAILGAVKRVLRDDGTLWLVVGDSYFGDTPPRLSSAEAFSKTWSPADSAGRGGTRRSAAKVGDLKPKDLVGIPWMVAFALRADGWYLRSEIIWDKPNCLPESVKDRPTKSHESIFLLTKRRDYFYDAEAISEGRNARSVWTISTRSYTGAHFAVFPPELPERCIRAGTSERGACAHCGAPWLRIRVESKVQPVDYDGKWAEMDPQSRGRRMLANVRARRIAGEDHDNPFPRSETIGWAATCQCDCLEVVPCVVLDPFAGSGTALMVAKDLGRNFVGVELNEFYRPLIEDRVRPALERARQRALFDEMISAEE
jgi:DNA modification methylase